MNEKYIPLYRKYRPQTIEELVGQDHIKKALSNAIALNKISHAYLFTGPRGTGKTSTARIFAKSLNCKKGPTASPCGKCECCSDIMNSIPMDVIEIDAASNRKVEDAQNILEKILYAPVNGKYKIYIIDEVHMLSNTAFNALLKTLEEPPANVIFILATTEVHKVLDTIKSRCQRFDFRRITTDDIIKHLRFISDKEKINITDDALFTIAKNSAGGMRDSIALLDQLSVLDSKEAISTDDINSLLGRLSFEVLNKLTGNIINSQPQEAIETLEDIYNSGNEPVQILTNLMDYLKNLLIVKNCRKEIVLELTQLSAVYIDDLGKQVEKLDTQQIVFLIEKCSDYIKELKTTNNPRLWLEVGIIDLANLAENTSLRDLQERLIKLESGASQNVPNVAVYKTPPAPILKPEIKQPIKVEESKQEIKKEEIKITSVVEHKPEKQQSTSKESNIVDTSNIAELWAQLLFNIQSAPTQALLKQWANPVEISPGSVILSMKSEMLLKQFVDGNKKKMLETAVNQMFEQENSKVLVRLPQSDDVQIKAAPQLKPKVIPHTTTVSAIEEQSSEEVEEFIEEIKEEPKRQSIDTSMHSDQVNMVVDIFDGKFID